MQKYLFTFSLISTLINLKNFSKMLSLLLNQSIIPVYYHKVLNYINISQIHSNINITQLMRRNNSYYKTCNYSSELEQAVNKQIESEKQAALVYLDMAVKFLHPSISYMGAGGFYMKMYLEELGHMQQFINYQLTRGGTPIVNSSLPVESNITLLNSFNQSLEMEKKITEQLECLVSVAETAKDRQCADFVTSKFLGEQMLSINELAQFVAILNRLGDSKHAIYHFDLQLAKKFPYSLK